MNKPATKTAEDIRNAIRADWTANMSWYEAFCVRKSESANNPEEFKARKRAYAVQFLAQVRLCEQWEILERDEIAEMKETVYDIYGAIIL